MPRSHTPITLPSSRTSHLAAGWWRGLTSRRRWTTFACSSTGADTWERGRVFFFTAADAGRDVTERGHRSKIGESARQYALMTTFPNRELKDGQQTLQAANLANAVIVQRYL